VPKKKSNAEDVRRPHHVRLPGFVHEEEVGLGDAIKRATFALGIKPCIGCERRAATLNRLLVFKGRSRGRSTKGGW
jgi:hypothetical protein